MKRILLTSTSIAALLLAFGCAEDNHGRIDQLDKDLPAPQPVEVTKVKPISGGAVLWVKIPDDKNIKGVVATYTRGGVSRLTPRFRVTLTASRWKAMLTLTNTR